MFYGSETWFQTKKLENKIQVFLNKCLRRILKIFWPNTITNEELWSRTNQDNVQTQILQRKFRWLGHTLRKENTDITKTALRWNPQGNRNRGRPKTTWRRQLLKDLGTQKLNLGAAESLAKERASWRNLVRGLSS